jgi:hypothetical protein
VKIGEPEKFKCNYFKPFSALSYFTVADLRKLDKAKILYNHIWFGSLNNDLIAEIYEDKRYLKIIEHSNYNPRLISFITDAYRLTAISKNTYWDYIQNTLNRPKDIWKNVIEIQLDTECRHVIVGIVLHGKSIQETVLKNYINRLKSNYKKFDNTKSTDSIIRLLVGALINRNQRPDLEPYYDLFNPSIGDYIIAEYFDQPKYMAYQISYLKTEEALFNLINLYRSKIITQNNFRECCNKIFKYIKEDNDNHLENKFYSKLLSILIDHSIQILHFNQYLATLVNLFFETDEKVLNYSQFKIVKYCLEKELINDENKITNCSEHCLEYEIYDNEDLALISDILDLYDSPDYLNKLLKETVIEFISDTLKNNVIEEGIYSDIFNEEEIDYAPLYHYVNGLLSDFAILFSNEEINEICEYCDLYDIVQYNLESSMHYDDDDRFPGNTDSFGSDNAIEDLFDRN